MRPVLMLSLYVVTQIVHVGCQYCIFDPPAEASLDIKYGRHA